MVLLQKTVGITCNDRKQRLIQAGMMTNSCSYNCDCCILHKDELHILPTDQFERGRDLGYLTADREHQQYVMREGHWLNTKNYERYREGVENGTIKLTDAAAKEVYESCRSTNKKPLRLVHPSKILPDPMHTFSGEFNHFLQLIRLELREIDDKSDFMQGMLQAVNDVEKRLDKIATTKRKNCQVASKVSPIHKDSLKLRRGIKAQLNKVNEFRDKREDLEEEEGFDENKFDEHLIQLTAKYHELVEEFRDHIKDSGYGHYVQEFNGLTSFSEAASKFLLPSCKKPHGILEFLLIQLIKYLVGADLRKENGGFDLSGGDAMDTLECFPHISELIVASIGPSNPRYEEIKNRFDEFERVAEALLNWGKALKSQERVDPVKFLDTQLYWTGTFDEVFPATPYFPKKHDDAHFPPFVDEYEFCGRGSTEGNESNGVRRKQILERLKSIVSTAQRYRSTFARTNSSLKEGMPAIEAAITKRMSGTKRGRYNVDRSTRRTDSVTSITLNENTIEFEGEVYLVVPGDGRINVKIRDYYMLVKHLRAPDGWMQTVKPLLLGSRAEQAQRTTY